MDASKKLILLNISGADWKQIHPLVDAGRMPVMAKLIEEGCIGNLWAPQPLKHPIPAMTLATGHFPAKHRVFNDFVPDADVGARRLSPADVKAATIWDMVQAQGKRAVAIGWPGSHPAPTIGPLVISDAFSAASGDSFENWPFDTASISDPTLASDLSQARMHPKEIEPEMVGPFVPKLGEIDQDTDARLAQYMVVFAQAMSVHSAATWAAEFTDWDFLAVNLDLIEHQSALFMQYQAPQMGHVTDTDHALYEGVVAGSYQFLDMLIERYLQLLPEGGHLVLTSDHGFESADGRSRPASQAADKVLPQYRDFGIFSVWGPRAKPDGAIFGATMVDIVPTVLAMLGLAKPDDLPGKVLADAFSAPLPQASCDPIAVSENLMTADTARTKRVAQDLAMVGYNVPRKAPLEIIENQLKLDAHLGEARDLIARGRLKSAEEVLLRALEVSPGNGAALRLRFHSSLNSKNLVLARIVLEELLELEPFATDLTISQGDLAVGERAFEAALEHYETALEDIPLGNAGTKQLVRVAKGQLRAKSAARAEATFKAALKRNGMDLAALTGLGEALAKQQRHEEAIAVLRKSLGGRSKQLNAQYLLAQCYLAIKKFDEAEEATRAAIEIAPGFQKATKLLTRIREQHAKYLISATEARGS